MAASNDKPKERWLSLWGWLLLALWFAWLGSLIYLSRHEWCEARPSFIPDNPPPAQTRKS